MCCPFVKEAQFTLLPVKEAQVGWSQCYTRVESIVVFLIKEQSVEIKEAPESVFILVSGDNSRVCGGSLWWIVCSGEGQRVLVGTIGSC